MTIQFMVPPDLFGIIEKKSDEAYLFWYMSYEEDLRFIDLCITSFSVISVLLT